MAVVLARLLGRDSSVGIATRQGLDDPGSNPSVDEIFRTRPARPWAPHSLLYNGYRLFPGVKRRAWRWLSPPPPSRAEVKERVSLTSTPPLGLVAWFRLELYLYWLHKRGFLVRFPIQMVRGAHSPMGKVGGAWLWSLIYLVTAPSILTTTNTQIPSGASSGNAGSETTDWEFIADVSSNQRIFAWSILINARKPRAPTL